MPAAAADDQGDLVPDLPHPQPGYAGHLSGAAWAARKPSSIWEAQAAGLFNIFSSFPILLTSAPDREVPHGAENDVVEAAPASI